MRVFDGLGTLTAAVLVALTLFYVQQLHPLELPVSPRLRASSGYLAVGAMLAISAWLLTAALRGSFGSAGRGYEANDAGRTLLLRRIVGYALLAVGGASLWLIRTALD
jgi:hypothetical protein